MVLDIPTIFKKPTGTLIETRIIKAFIKEDAGAPIEEYGEGALVVNMVENRLYVQVTGSEQQPWAHYKLNETTGTNATDVGSGGNDATASNAGIWNTGGKYDGGAYTTVGDGFTISIPADNNWDFNEAGGDFTIMFWYRQIPGGNDLDVNVRFLERVKAGLTDYWYIGGTSGQAGKLSFASRAGGGAASLDVTSLSRLDDEDWHHVAIVHDDSADNLKLYIDGKIEAENTSYTKAIDFAGTEVTTLIKSQQPGGVMDEVKLFNSVKTQTEINNDSLRSAGLVWAYTDLTGA